METNSNKYKKLGTISSIVLAATIAILIRIFIFEPFSIPSGSMKPNLLIGDYIIVSKFPYGISNHSIPFAPSIFNGRILSFSKPQRGDVVVFKFPPDNSTYYIKRIVGLPGDIIQVKESNLYINGQMVHKEPSSTFTDDDDNKVIAQYVETLLDNKKKFSILDETSYNYFDNTPEYNVPEGKYFMMGDNRDNSLDSRYESRFVPEENIVGRAEFILFSNNVSILKIWKWLFNFNSKRFFTAIH
jgi:signal peptidase I